MRHARHADLDRVVALCQEEAAFHAATGAGGAPPATADGATGEYVAGGFLRPGRYAYLNIVGVTEEHCGRGLGALIVAGVLDELHEIAPDGTFLWFESRNPVSPGFWQAMGYRAMWTRYQRAASR